MGAFSDDALTDVAAHYWNGNIVLQAPIRPVELALALARESGRPVNGLLGPWDQVRAVEPELDLDRTRLGKVVPEYLYRLDLVALVVPESLSSGRVVHRHARDDDLPTLVRWRHEYELHTMGFPAHSIDDAANRDSLARMIGERCLWVLEEAGRPVCMTAFNAALPENGAGGRRVHAGGVAQPRPRARRGGRIAAGRQGGRRDGSHPVHRGGELPGATGL